MSKNTGKFASGHRKSKAESSLSEESGITQVDLTQYKFSPPGAMGWTEKEYEKLIEALQNRKKN